MADTKYSALTLGSALADADEWGFNQGGNSRRVTGRLLRDYIGSTIRNVSVADQSPSAGATTYLTGSNIAVPAGLLRVGTFFRWTLIFTKTAAGTAARSHLIKVGTNGTTADATIVTLTTGTPSAAVDTGCQIITWIVRTIGAAATSHGASVATHQLSTTGLFPNETGVLQVDGSTFNSTVANLIVGLAVTVGASEALTYKQVIAEVYNL